MIVCLISGISFTPREVGEHLVNVFRNGQHINGSPFKIIVGESELGNASKVRVAGEGLQNGMANEINEFMVDTRDAGTRPDELPTTNQLFIQDYFFIMNWKNGLRQHFFNIKSVIMKFCNKFKHLLSGSLWGIFRTIDMDEKWVHCIKNFISLISMKKFIQFAWYETMM